MSGHLMDYGDWPPPAPEPERLGGVWETLCAIAHGARFALTAIGVLAIAMAVLADPPTPKDLPRPVPHFTSVPTAPHVAKIHGHH